jgi:hypothetical protein
MTTLHCRRQVRLQGLRDLGRPARRRRLGGQRAVGRLEVEVARGRKLYRQRFARGKPQEAEKLGEVHNRRGTKVRFHPRPADLRQGRAFEPARLFRMARSKAYLFGGVEIRWSCDPSLLVEGHRRSGQKASSTSPAA